MAVLDILSDWMPHQRWFAGKTHAPRLRLLDVQVGQPDGAATYLVMDDAGSRPTLYQVPVVALREVPDELREAMIGHDGDLALVDAPHHPGFALALLERMGVATDRVTASRVLRGEQSNTSLVYDVDGVPTLIAKLFRALHHGENPDVTLQSALSRAGSPYVPHFIGEIEARWPDVGRDGGEAQGTAAFAQEFLPGVRDGWTIALEEATADRSFTEAARDLGAAVAGVHAILADVMPTRPATELDMAGMAGTWARRLRAASAEVPQVAERRPEIEALYRAAGAAARPVLQRVHGDLHLGQVLAVPEGGWRIVDFEGEPLRPMTERSEPDAAARDVAGMLRSFDYAAGAAGTTGLDRRSWAAACRAEFLAAYAAASPTGSTADPLLVEVLELDKAVYETIYEARNRPGWLGIPLGGIDAILARTAG
jgi:maltokinase